MPEYQEREKRASGTVRITLPASVAYSPDRLKSSIAKLAEQIGHPECFSGADCLFQMEREFLFGDGEMKPRAAAAVGGDAPISVAMAPRVKYDLGSVEKAIDRVIDLIGPHPCISGFDVLFRDEMLVINEQLEAQRFG